MGDVFTGRLARPAVQDFFLRFAGALDKHFDSEFHPDEQTKWLDHYLEQESILHRNVGLDMEGITEKDVRLMMAIYLWEVHYLIKTGSTEKPVMAAYNFVMSDRFQNWKQSNPVVLNEGIFATVASSVYARLPALDARVQQFNAAAQSIAKSAGPPEEYRRAPPFDDTGPEYDSGSESFESVYEETQNLSYFNNTTEAYSGLGASSGVRDDEPENMPLALSNRTANIGETQGGSLPFLDSLDDAARNTFLKMCDLVQRANNDLFVDTLLMMFVRICSDLYTEVKVQTFLEMIVTDSNFNGSFPYVKEERIENIIEKIRSVYTIDSSTPQDEESFAITVFTREVFEECARIEQYLYDPERSLSTQEEIERFYGVETFGVASDEFVQSFDQSVLGFLMPKETEDQLTNLDERTSWKDLAVKIGIGLYSSAVIGYMFAKFSDTESIGGINSPRPAQPFDNTPFDPVGAPYPRTEKDHVDAYLSAGTYNLLIGVYNFLTKDITRPIPLDEYNYVNAGGHLEFETRKKKHRRRRPRPTFFDHTLTV